MKLNEIGVPMTGAGILTPYRQTMESYGLYKLRCAKAAAGDPAAVRMKEIMSFALWTMLDEKLVTDEELMRAGAISVERENELFWFTQGVKTVEALIDKKIREVVNLEIVS